MFLFFGGIFLTGGSLPLLLCRLKFLRSVVFEPSDKKVGAFLNVLSGGVKTGGQNKEK